MSLQDDVQKGKDRYVGSRLKEHDQKLGDLDGRLKQIGEPGPVEVPEELANFVAGLRGEEGGTDDLIIVAVFEHFGLGAFSDRQIASALVPTPQAEGDEPSEQDPGDEPGSDEDPGE